MIHLYLLGDYYTSMSKQLLSSTTGIRTLVTKKSHVLIEDHGAGLGVSIGVNKEPEALGRF